MKYIIITLLSLITLGSLLGSPIKEWFLDLPDERKQHQRLIPRMGGFGVLIAFLISILAMEFGVLELDAFDTKLALVAALCFGLIGLFDDSNMVSIWLRKRNKDPEKKKHIKWELPVRYKFLIEFGLSGFTIWSLKLYGTSFFIFSHEFKINAFIIALLAIWIVGVMNAFNIVDGLDTLCGGISLLTFSGIAYVAYLLGNPAIYTASLVLVALILGFLYHNYSPANVFMGDSGSLFMGYWAGVLPLMLMKSNPKQIHFEAMLYLVGLPVLDVFVAMFRRFFIIGRGKKVKSRLKNMVSADANHLHHRFVYFGLSHLKASSLMFAFALLFICSAVIVSDGKPHQLIHSYLIVSTLLVLFAAYTQWNITGAKRWFQESYEKVVSYTEVVHVVGDETLASSLETLDYNRIEYSKVNRLELGSIDEEADIILVDQKSDECLDALKVFLLEVDSVTEVPILLLVNDDEAMNYFTEHLRDYKSKIHLLQRPPFSSQVFIQIFETVKEIKSYEGTFHPKVEV